MKTAVMHFSPPAFKSRQRGNNESLLSLLTSEPVLQILIFIPNQQAENQKGIRWRGHPFDFLSGVSGQTSNFGSTSEKALGMVRGKPDRLIRKNADRSG